jgi:diphthamide biosynthesis methyltransferase
MLPKQAYDILESMMERLDKSNDIEVASLIGPISDWNTILLSDIGTSQQMVVSGSFSNISEIKGGGIHCLILPTEFSGMEKDVFEHLKADM